MRCAMNLSSFGSLDDPGRAMADAAAGLAIARRRRTAGWAGALAGNWADAAFEMGDWDSILALAADLDGEGLLPVDESASIFVPVHMVHAYRGGIGEATLGLDRTLGGQMDDLQIARAYHDTFAHLRFAAGDHDASHEHERGLAPAPLLGRPPVLAGPLDQPQVLDDTAIAWEHRCQGVILEVENAKRRIVR